MILTILVVFLIALLFLLGMGLGIGFLLHWLIPAVELGIGILIGVVAAGISAFYVVRILTFSKDVQETVEEHMLFSKLEEMSESLGNSADRRKEKSITHLPRKKRNE